MNLNIYFTEDEVRQNKLTGVWEEFYPNGNIRVKCEYKEGVLDGDCLFFDSDGHSSMKLNFKDDKSFGGITWLDSEVSEVSEVDEKQRREYVNLNDYYLNELKRAVDGCVNVMIEGEESYGKNDWKSRDPMESIRRHVENAKIHLEEVTIKLNIFLNVSPDNRGDVKKLFHILNDDISHAATRLLLAYELYQREINAK